MAQIKREMAGPVTLEQLKNHLHMFTCDFDMTLQQNIRAAVAKCENYINGAIWRGELSASVPFASSLRILEPTAVVTAVEVDGSSVNFDYDNGVLTVDGTGKKLKYTAQVGYTEEDCPPDIQMAVLLIAAKLFNNPVDSVENLPSASQNLLHPYRNYCI